jgi:tripartite-type tricarboxylate transporter receptor subunit TctC
MKRLGLAVALAVLSGFTAQAENFPSRTVTIVAPFAAGGPSDLIARIVGEGMKDALRQPVIVENVVGAGGTIGVGRVARAAPDGYTLALGNWGTFVVTGAVYSLPFDLLNDFEPISLLPAEPFLIASQPGIPAKDLKEFIAWLKANPGKATAASSGVGGPSHIAAVFFQKLSKTDLQVVPYRGAGPAMQGLVAGQVDLMIVGPSMALPQERAGKIKVYALAAKSRSPLVPDVATVEEAGLPGFHMSVWHGLWAPKGTPKDTIRALNAAVVRALNDPAARERFTQLGLEVPPADQQTPQALAAQQKAEIEKWWPIIKAAGIKAQ